ncbi:hypothetical protein POM88_010077 [Heracleum sosnowskyi]|uniref:Uncharacterized protein n=1 Tax=Heracleum sosnowskyi TaxID=360622 RepID=A0AAD8JB47_9APIA|nr:hypothetical protein POM88_010077 [Heracleum sosnowskyi]
MPKDRSCPITVSSLPHQGKCMIDRHHNQHHHHRHYCLSTPSASGRSERQAKTPPHIADKEWWIFLMRSRSTIERCGHAFVSSTIERGVLSGATINMLRTISHTC